MKQKNVQEYIGSLTKEESLQCLEDDLLIKDSCVLESVNPFFGYYAVGGPKVPKPQYLYLMLGRQIDFIDLQRILLQVNKLLKHTVDAVWATITVPDHPEMPALRIRDLQQYSEISILQQQFRDVGLPLQKHNKGVLLNNAIIKLKKFFFLEELEDGLFFDARQAHHGYFVIPEPIDWNHFKKLTAEAKNEVGLLYFDAATASIFTNNQIIELVRIYRENINVSKLKAIRDRYYKLMGLQ